MPDTSAGIEGGKTTVPGERTALRVTIDSDRAIIDARQQGRALAGQAGFALTDQAIVAAVIAEFARNILRYAPGGYVMVRLVKALTRPGIVIIASDNGPGIASVADVMVDGFSKSGSLGLGLPGVKRLVDEFEIASEIGRGTRVIAKKWK